MKKEVINNEDKKTRAKLIADTIQMLLQQIDMFSAMMTAEDIKILQESRESLQEKIGMNQSAMALICAIRWRL